MRCSRLYAVRALSMTGSETVFNGTLPNRELRRPLVLPDCLTTEGADTTSTVVDASDPLRPIRRTGAVAINELRLATFFIVRVVFSIAALTPSHFLLRIDSSRFCLSLITSIVAPTISVMQTPLESNL